ncbi:MAG: hypothetical protein ACLP1X_28800 [Polyangiaceae bacterium]|jgi:hypothetical protein
MTRKIWQHISWPIVFAGLSAPFLANCGAKIPGAPSLPGVGSCPDMANVEAIDSFDFAKNFSLKPEVGAKVKAGVSAAVEMKVLADKIDSDLKTACGTLAHDLGASGDFKDGQDACNAAVKVIGDANAKLGAKAKVSLDVDEPHCGVAVDAYADCAGHCDATVKPGQLPKCDGGKLQGTCSGQCSGECEVSAGAACSGECNGSCDAQVKGACSGNCSGKCDGKATPAGAGGECSGTCEGKCSGNVKATCSGKCQGSCQMKAQASCSGTCSGSCSAEMQAPKCTGKLEPPQMSGECKAKCDAKLQAKAECTPPHIVLRITGAADAKFAATFQSTLIKDLPAVLTVALGMGARLGDLATSMEAVVGGVQATVQGAGDPMTVGRLTACVGAPFKGAIDAVTNVKASVKVSVSVQASASAGGGSASASASAKAG